MGLTGNRCGHAPHAPALDLAVPVRTGQGGMPLVLTRAMEYLERYYESPSLFPTLDAANTSSRRQRSERREACVRLLKALLRYVDITSLRVGFASPEGFKPITLDLLVDATGMHKRRVERAHADLKTAGIISCKQPRDTRPDGQIIGLAGIRAISKHLWGRLGLSRLLSKQRKAHSQKLKRKAAERHKKQEMAASQGLTMNAIAQGVAKRPSGRKPGQGHQEDQRRLQLLALEIKRRRPELTADQVNQQARQELGM